MKKYNLIYILALCITMFCNLNNALSQATSANGTNSPAGAGDYLGWTSSTNRDLNINNQDAYHIRFYTNNSERMRILGSGNTGYVGIATTSPTSVLHIDGNGTSSTTGEVFRTDGPGATLQTWKILKGGTEYGRLSLPASGSNFNIAAMQDNLNFLSGNSGTQLEAMRIVGGNGANARFIGIGDWTTLNTAQSQLHQFISGNNNIYHQFTNDNTAHTNSSQGFKIGITYNGGAGVSHAELNQQENADMLFSTNAVERMRILSGGDVGIATASPTARLHVVGASSSSSATYSLKSEVTSSTSTANPIYSIYGSSTGASRPLFGGYLVADGTTNGNNNDVVGLYLDSKNGSNLNIGIDLYATAKSGALDNLGIRAEASGSSTLNYGMNINAYGNSGSPVINANGELIGTNFDRVWEGTMSDIMFHPSLCRNITLDIRYTLFIIDKFAGAKHLVEEMTLVSH